MATSSILSSAESLLSWGSVPAPHQTAEGGTVPPGGAGAVLLHCAASQERQNPSACGVESEAVSTRPFQLCESKQEVSLTKLWCQMLNTSKGGSVLLLMG